MNESGDTEKWEFSGGSWAVGNFSQVGAKKMAEIHQKIGVFGEKVSKFKWNMGKSWYVSTDGKLSRYSYNSMYTEPIHLDVGTYVINYTNASSLTFILTTEYPIEGVEAVKTGISSGELVVSEPSYLLINDTSFLESSINITIDTYKDVIEEKFYEQEQVVEILTKHTLRKTNLIEGLTPSFNPSANGEDLFVPLFEQKEREIYIELPELYSCDVRIYKNGLADSDLLPQSETTRLRYGIVKVDQEALGLYLKIYYRKNIVNDESLLLSTEDMTVCSLDYVDEKLDTVIYGNIKKEVKQKFTTQVQSVPYISNGTVIFPSSFNWSTAWLYVNKGIYLIEGFATTNFDIILATVDKLSDIVNGCKGEAIKSYIKDNLRYIVVKNNGFIKLLTKYYSDQLYIYNRINGNEPSSNLEKIESKNPIDISNKFGEWYIPSFNAKSIRNINPHVEVPIKANIEIQFNKDWYADCYFYSKKSDVDPDKSSIIGFTPGTVVRSDFGYMTLAFYRLDNVTDEMIDEFKEDFHVTILSVESSNILDVSKQAFDKVRYNLDLPRFAHINIITDEGDSIESWPVDKDTKHHTRIEYSDGGSSFNCFSNTSYQGSSSIGLPQKNFRLRLYSDDELSSKKKIKLGSMIETNQFNLKAYYTDITQCKEPIIYRLWLKAKMDRDFDSQFPWSGEQKLFSSATGCYFGFPVEVSVDGEFYGISFMLNKKDGDNYLLDSTDNGLLVCGESNLAGFWSSFAQENFSDEIDDAMSESTAEAVRSFIEDFCSKDEAYIQENANDRLYIDDWIDYYIFVEVFGIVDNYAKNILLYSGADKHKFSAFLYDLDWSFGYNDRTGITYDVLTMNNAQAKDVTFFKKFVSVFWLRIVDRFNYLYNNGFISYEAVKNEFINVQSNIPNSSFEKQMGKWPNKFTQITDTPKFGYTPKLLAWYKNRIEWLKNNLFYADNINY